MPGARNKHGKPYRSGYSRKKAKLASLAAQRSRLNKKQGGHSKQNGLCMERRKQWIRALRRKGLTDKILLHERVCSKHFISGKPAALDDVDNPDWVPSINMGYTKNSNKGLLSDHDEEEALGMYDQQTHSEPIVKVEEVDFNYEEETQELEESLRNVASNKKALTDIKIKYLEEEHRVKMDILKIEKENAEIQNETLKIEYEIKKIDLINQRMNIDNNDN